MRTALLFAALLLSGCAISLALGPEKFRIIEFSSQGGDTFCWQGAGFNNVGIRPVGWGPGECNWSTMPTPRDEMP